MGIDTIDRLWLRDERFRQTAALVVDLQPAIKELAELDGDLGKAEPLRLRRDIDHLRSQFDRVVVGDHLAVLEAEDVIERAAFGPGYPGRLWVGGRHGEASVVFGEIALQDGI